MSYQCVTEKFPTDSGGRQIESPAPLAGGNRADRLSNSNGTRDSTAGAARATAAGELRELARAVRNIGSGYRSNPESIAMAKEEVSHRLVRLARRIEGGAA